MKYSGIVNSLTRQTNERQAVEAISLEKEFKLWPGMVEDQKGSRL